MRNPNRPGRGQPPMAQWLNQLFPDGDSFGPTVVNRDVVPAVNVRESPRHYSIELAAPGFDKTDFHVHLDDDALVVSAEKREQEREEGERFTRKEFNYTSFSRAFSLPDDAVRDSIRAQYQDGILTLTIERAGERPKPQPTRIDIA